MERRNFLRGAALAGTGAALATPAVSGGHGTVLTTVSYTHLTLPTILLV